MACAGVGRTASPRASGVNSGSLLLPVGSGIGYALGAIAIKRSLGAGASGGWVNLVCNAVTGVFFQFLWFLPGHTPDVQQLMAPVACGLLFFLGQVFTFRAIDSGDVSIATPLLGVKVLFVAIFSVILLGKPLPGSWWTASFLASLGIALISYSPGGFHRHLFPTIGWSLGAAAAFALTDVMVQNWVPGVGYSRFAPVMFGIPCLLSVIYLPGLLKERGKAPSTSHSPYLPWLLGGALLLAVQSLGVYTAIGLYGSAAATNILYGSRCLWSVLFVWILGPLAVGAVSTENSSVVMVRRFFGALLLFAAMSLVLRSGN